eukprot:362300-Chlamydomonas_euryale.AAC.4
MASLLACGMCLLCASFALRSLHGSWLGPHSPSYSWCAGSDLCQQGEEGDRLWILTEGRVDALQVGWATLPSLHLIYAAFTMRPAPCTIPRSEKFFI